MNERPKLNFPRIESISLENFSLYNLRPSITVDFPNGVFCLTGANGLGKSTFLAALNYGITGVVLDPRRPFETAAKLHRNRPDFSRSYFDGKIKEGDRDRSSVSIQMLLNGYRFRITRPMFDSKSLSFLTIYDEMEQELVFDGAELTDEEKASAYEVEFSQNVGVKSFDQYVFLQLYVLTFDESRHLLFWDERALNEAISYCIGADFEKAHQMSKLHNEMERAASLARNFGFQASNVRGRLQMVLDASERADDDSDTNDLDIENLKKTHQELDEEYRQQQHLVETKKNALSDADLVWMDSSSKLTLLKDEYADDFSRRVDSSAHVRFHPTVSASISEAKCAICGSTEAVETVINAKIEKDVCPLCEQPISKVNEDPGGSMDRLIELDKKIQNEQSRLTRALETRKRLQAELKAAEDTLHAKTKELQQFEAANESALLKTENRSGVEAIVKNLQYEIDALIAQKEEKYAERDKKRKEYLRLQRELHDTWLDVQEHFVPLFRKLAYLFIGVDLDIRAEYSISVTSPGMNFTLEVKGTTRRREHQLSESQRFFLDIALRMALAQYTSKKRNEAALLVDTPEGSLDIAYESRVGQMFAGFVDGGHNIIMTTNINSSQILRRLARECGRSRMHLHMMTMWTELSEVQLAEQELFDLAVEEIEASYS